MAQEEACNIPDKGPEKTLDKKPVERYHSPKSNVRPFKYEPVCIACRSSSQLFFYDGCEGCRERKRLVSLSKENGK